MSELELPGPLQALGPWAAVPGLVALFTLSAVFSGTETALFSLQAVDRQRFEGDALGRRVLDLLRRRVAVISSILIGNETVNVSISTIGAFLVSLAMPQYPWLNVVLLTPALLLISEMTPKVIAYRYNARWSRVVAWPLTAWVALVSPARLVVGGVVTVLSWLFGVRYGQVLEQLQEAEILALLEQGAAAGRVDPREREIAEAVFDFDELAIGRLMTPLPSMFAVPLDIAWNDLLARCREQGHSRVPVYEGSTDNVVGVLLLKDLIKHRNLPLAGPRQLRTMLLPPVFVPRSKPADTMLREFLERRFHMAFVVNEHGTLVGLVTLDDLLSELVGELLDAGDDDSVRTLERPTPGVFDVKGIMDLEDFARESGIALPEGEYDTVGGFVFHQLGRLPVEGDVVRWREHRFVVTSMDGRRIGEVRVETVRGGRPPDEQEIA